MKNSKKLLKYVRENYFLRTLSTACFGGGGSIIVYLGLVSLIGIREDVRQLFNLCLMTGIILVLIPIVPILLSLLTTVIMDGVSFLFGKTQKKLDPTLSSSKIEPFVLDSDSQIDLIDDDLIKEICEEVVCDQLGRGIVDDEVVSLLESTKLEDGGVLAIFRYRKHSQKRKSGSTKDVVFSSIHIIKLKLDRLSQVVRIEPVSSFDGDCLSELSNPLELIHNLVQEPLCGVSQSYTQVSRKHKEEVQGNITVSQKKEIAQ